MPKMKPTSDEPTNEVAAPVEEAAAPVYPTAGGSYTRNADGSFTPITE